MCSCASFVGSAEPTVDYWLRGSNTYHPASKVRPTGRLAAPRHQAASHGGSTMKSLAGQPAALPLPAAQLVLPHLAANSARQDLPSHRAQRAA